MAQKRKSSGGDGDLFIEGAGQLRLVDKSAEQQALEKGKVECLGMTFDSEDARRAYFNDRLREKLADPEFRKTPGFPKGSDEHIIRMSDPPWYTACPNPFARISPTLQPSNEGAPYSAKPYTADVSEGRHEPIYLAHTYHAKVPWRAVLRYVLAYTQPGAVVYDGFAGTGMTGVACRFAQRPPADLAIEGPFVAGPRHVMVGDLSPAAGLISSVYNNPCKGEDFTSEAGKVLSELAESVGHLFRTKDQSGRECDVSYFVWSDVFYCPHCHHEDTYFSLAYSREEKVYRENFACPGCHAELNKAELVRAFESEFDSVIGQPANRIRQRLVIRSFKDSAGKRRHVKPEAFDLDIVELAAAAALPKQVPCDPIPYMHMTHERNNLAALGVTHAHHFFTRRSLIAIGTLFELIWSRPHPVRRALLFWLTSCLPKLSRLMNYNADGIGRVTKGIFYFPSVTQEFSPFPMLARAAKDVRQCLDALNSRPGGTYFVSTHDAQSAPLSDQSIDYVFTDPPFGENIYYSDLNYLWESWLGIRTDVSREAIISKNKERPKDLATYAGAMARSFAEYYRVLKPGRWITVEFHNSANAVWKALQEALTQAGFVIVDVRILDKKLKTFKQIVTTSTVKQDLIITAYRPTLEQEEQCELLGGTPDGAWVFVRDHLEKLPVTVVEAGALEVVAERQAHRLFDRMIAYHVVHNIVVPLSFAEFLGGLSQRYPERDGMFFLPTQVAEYDRKRNTATELRQLSLFVIDEASAIQWVRRELQDKPRSFQDIQPAFMREIQNWAKHEQTVELKEILRQNCILYDGNGPVPSQIHSYLSTNFKELRNLAKDDPTLTAKAADRWYVPDPGKQGDLEKLREKALLTEFETYKNAKERKLKVFRTEAVRAGFKVAYEGQDYKTIVSVAAKLPENVLQEDEKLLMYYDVASMRLGVE
jgi:hypothetical protein